MIGYKKLNSAEKKRHGYGLLALFALAAALLLLPFSEGGRNDAPKYSFSLAVLSTGAEVGAQTELDGLLDRFFSLLPDGFSENSGELVESVGIEALFDNIIRTLSGQSSETGAFLLLLIGISVLFSAAELALTDSGELKATALCGVGIVLSLPVFFALSGVISAVSEGIENASLFFSGIIPIMSSVTALGGGASSAAVQAAGMSASLSFVSVFLTETLIPAVAMLFSLSLLSSTGSDAIAPISRGAKSFFLFFLGAATTVILGTLALQTVIASSKDTVLLRGVKYAVSGMIPIVGGTVSGALGALSSGVLLVGNTVGAASVAVLITVIGAPLIQLLLYKAAFGICIGFMDFSGAAFGHRIFSSLGSALDAMIALLAASGIIYVLEVILFMKYGVVGI